MTKFDTNRELLDSLPRRVTIVALAERLGTHRNLLSLRLNNDDRPDPAFVKEVLEASEAIMREAK